MKKTLLLTLLSLVLLVSCAKGGFVTSDYDITSVSNELLLTEEFGDGMVYASGTSLELSPSLANYYFDEEDLLEGVDSYVYITSSDEHVSEVGIFKVKNPEAFDEITDAIGDRREALIQIHTNYDQNDLAISKGLTIGRFDDVIYFVATDNNSAIEEIIKK